MRVLFDQGVPVPLRSLLPGHEVVTARERGWSTLDDGQLLSSAEGQGFEVLLPLIATFDTNQSQLPTLLSRHRTALPLAVYWSLGGAIRISQFPEIEFSILPPE